MNDPPDHPYEPPEIVSLGSIFELTGGGLGMAADEAGASNL